MEIIFHIGMGKTGTSSIQKALAENKENLLEQGVDYLGMFFDLINPVLRDNYLQREFFASSTDKNFELAGQFIETLKNRQRTNGASRFLLSNESLLQQHRTIAPFFEYLSRQVCVRLIIYARDPRDWLPSAYNQWFVYHKTSIGPIPPFAKGGRQLLSMYEDLNTWQKILGAITTIRPFTKSTDVVADLAKILAVEMPVATQRVQERVEKSESFLRAIYNNRFPEMVLPERFDRAFQKIDLNKSPALAEVLRENFKYDETDAVVAEQASLFAEIKERTGVDLLDGPSPLQETPDLEAIRQRIMEHVLYIVMQQADRIAKLEGTVRKLQDELGGG
ncbi:MAG: polysaccharide biosynthesis protein [Rhodobacteraceae bacterium]|nr:polysaccharide biosynthesis protein [Paracoccaceae bacterium]